MTRKSIHLCLASIIMAGFFTQCEKTLSQSRVQKWDLSFKGSASGGTLVLATTRNRSVEFVSIATSRGESADSVVSHLADAINGFISVDTSHARYDKNKLWQGDFRALGSGGTLTLPGSIQGYILGGTEVGLGIPEPPTSLTCSQQGSKIVLRWINPLRPYDFIVAKVYWTDFDNVSTNRLPASAESFTVDTGRIPLDIQDADFRVVGVRDNIPSNAASIHVSGFAQSELYGIPFTDNIAPNWKAWTGGQPDKLVLECLDKYPQARGFIPATTLQTKPFYQVIKAPGSNASHGIYRQFLGLPAGHTYRLTACVSTLEMDSVTSPWSFSVCAAAGTSSSSNLTAQQMAGAAPLPNGTQGPKAGCVASFASGRTTKGQFSFVLTGDRDEQGEEVAHIALPPGTDSITVWLRFSCSDPQGKVAFSGVMLEDITANPNVVPAEKIREAAYKAEERLMRGIADQLERKSPPK
jgi:hypothetical protein